MPLLASEHVSLPTKDVLSWMLDEPTYDENKPILISADDPSRSICRRQARIFVRRIAAGLRRAGLQSGDCVCLHAFNDIYYTIACLGIVAAGGVYAGTSPAYTAFELEHYIRIARIRFWIADPSLLANIRAASLKAGIPECNIFAFDLHGESVPAGIISWNTLQLHGESDWHRFNDLEEAKTTSVVRLFSSGTTGLPKAMDVSHYNLTSQHTIVMEHRPRPYEVRRLVCNPMFLIAQVARTHTSALRAGVATYVMRRFTLEPWLANVDRYQITELNLVPAMAISILQSGLLTKYPLSSLKNILSGSAPLDKDLQLRLKSKLPQNTVFNQTWGMSETCCNGMYFYYPEQDMTGSVGRPLPNHDMKLVDDDGKDVTATDVAGELCMRGPSMFSGYFDGKSVVRRDYDDDDFFHTGDIAQRSEAGLWYIVGRKKDLIKTRGFQVAPAEIEGVLLRHPDIVDAAVIGVQESADKSEFPRAYLVVRHGATLTSLEVQEYVSQHLAKYKRLEAGVRFVAELPKNANSKVLKNILRDQAKREIAATLRESGQYVKL